MSGETEASVSGWTVDTLRAYVFSLMQESDKRYEQRFISQQEAIQAAMLAQKEAIQAALIAADRAVAKAETASEKRFEGVNEFRGQLADQAAHLMPRSEAEARIQAIFDKLSEVIDRVNRSEGKGAGNTTTWGIVVVLVSLTFGLIGAVATIVILFRSS